MARLAFAAAFGTALLAASVAFATRGTASASAPASRFAPSLAGAAKATAAAASYRFRLCAQIGQGGVPYVLHVEGATGRSAQHVHLKVADMSTADGSKLTGPSADVKTDDAFLYVRSTATRSLTGPLWVRERLSTLTPDAPELQTMRQVEPSWLLRILPRARGVTRGPDAGVFHARLSYADPVVRKALAGVEGEIEYRHLRLTAWVAPNGLLRLLLVTGRTADGSSHFLLTLALDRYGRPVGVTPPPGGQLVDFDLSKLRA